MPHKPVLVKEVLEGLDLKPGMVVVDGTLGNAGHALEILELIGTNGRLIGLDQDPEAIKRCEEKLKNSKNVSLHQENFDSIEKVLDILNVLNVNAVLLDIGFSSNQLEDTERGFSFDRPGPLDMRMNPGNTVKAADLVNDLSEEELEKMFQEYGNERWARKFAQAICRERNIRPIETTNHLIETIQQAMWGGKRKDRPGWARRHPATRVFQALRIVVNDELGALKRGLLHGWKRLKPGGRFAVISFHSLEDRIVKHQFQAWQQAGEAKRITKKPITATREEEIANPRSRSAKLRVVEKIE